MGVVGVSLYAYDGSYGYICTPTAKAAEFLLGALGVDVQEAPDLVVRGFL